MKRLPALLLLLLFLFLCACEPGNTDYDRGYEDARNEFEGSGYDDGYDAGYEAAMEEFYNSRYREGYESGYEDGRTGEPYSDDSR